MVDIFEKYMTHPEYPMARIVASTLKECVQFQRENFFSIPSTSHCNHSSKTAIWMK
eukprot:TRINITY_DN236_c0_g2_i2.p1 TRINITY_DN236_c0_g2~~TRINITY_DN236_c0_g2_i2.p1  ORF type:complete len:56 (-),score=10.18 TRINITY_DN236_c0_g2_i2:211-378(-)